MDRSREPHYLVGLTQIATATSELPPVAFALSLCLQLYCPSGPEFGLLVFATPGRLLLALCFFFFFTTAFFLSFNVRQVNCRKNFAKLLLLSPFIGGKFLKCLFQASAKLISAGSKLKTRPPASLVGNYGAKWLVKVRISLLKLFCPAEKRSKIQLQLSGYQ